MNDTWEARLTRLETIIKVMGIPGLCLSINQAAKLLGVSATWISDEIKLAEALRILGETPHLTYGKHYFSCESSSSSQSTWKVDVQEFEAFLRQPPEQRKPTARALERLKRIQQRPKVEKTA